MVGGERRVVSVLIDRSLPVVEVGLHRRVERQSCHPRFEINLPTASPSTNRFSSG